MSPKQHIPVSAFFKGPPDSSALINKALSFKIMEGRRSGEGNLRMQFHMKWSVPRFQQRPSLAPHLICAKIVALPSSTSDDSDEHRDTASGPEAACHASGPTGHGHGLESAKQLKMFLKASVSAFW